MATIKIYSKEQTDGLLADKAGTSDLASKQDALTTTQLQAVNSGITSSAVSKLNGYSSETWTFETDSGTITRTVVIIP